MENGGPRVAIVGAGLGGLCLAQGLRRAGVPFTVYEKDAAIDSRTHGYRIRIDSGGQAALARCLPPELLRLFRHGCALSSGGGRFLGSGLEPVAGRPAASWRPAADSGDDDGGDGDLSAHRLSLRELLLCGIEPRLCWGREFAAYEPDGAGGAVLRFADGGTAAADLLVAADGVRSPVREQFLPQARPRDTGAVCVYGKTPARPPARRSIAPLLQEGTSVIFADGCAVIVDAMRFRAAAEGAARRLSAVEDYFYWAVIGPRGRFGLGPLQRPEPQALAELIARLGRDWHPGLRALFEHGERGAVALMPVLAAAAPPRWTPGAVTLLGDAIHAMSPAGGLGANTALCDAASLAAQLSEVAAGGKSLAQGVAAYEDDLRRRAGAALQASAQAAARLFGAG